jgi:type I restriction-modification system DNA methylase subunit
VRGKAGKVTERTFYPALIDLIRQVGGTGVQEINFDTEPDIVFELRDRKWILSVKIGEATPAALKDAFIQYMRHKTDSGLNFGMLLFLQESARKVAPSEERIREFITNAPVNAILDAHTVKEEVKGQPFPSILSFILETIYPRLEVEAISPYPLHFVMSLLKVQVEEMMSAVSSTERELLQKVVRPELLTELGGLKPADIMGVCRFLASYILMSQILFFRLLHKANSSMFPAPSSRPITSEVLRKAFTRVLDVNYRPIYEIDVLDFVPRSFLEDTFDLIWGLEVEGVRYEIPGRLFHQLMPFQIRKLLAAFYTKPPAASMLARLTIDKSEQTVFDPACGSGTILVEAYKRKASLFKKEGHTGNPHKQFCENDIFGADIMPFAVHLASANLAALDPTIIIDRTQIMHHDSLSLVPGEKYATGITQLGLFQQTPMGYKNSGEKYAISVPKMDVILMNPPFTKVERGIRNLYKGGKTPLIDMEKFRKFCGGEVGLWGHFVCLADFFVKENGVLGAVLPINLLRGESENVRKILFENWTPECIVKLTRNFGFSEGAAYRDILFVAKRKKATESHRVRFCLIKKKFAELSESKIEQIARLIRKRKDLRSDILDVQSFPTRQLRKKAANMMYFCGVSDFSHRDTMVGFTGKFQKILSSPAPELFRLGYYPEPKGVSQFIFLTRSTSPARTDRAFLRFNKEERNLVKASSPVGAASFKIERKHLLPTVRTPVGLSTMDISSSLDYVAKEPYSELPRVLRSAGISENDIDFERFWGDIPRELERTRCNVAVIGRINPYSPHSHLFAFASDDYMFPSNQMNPIRMPDLEEARALCVMLNSAVFLAQFFLLKEESTGPYIHIRLYDLEPISIVPREPNVKPLAVVFNRFRKVNFPSLQEQLDINFAQRFQEFCDAEKGERQRRMFSVLDKPVEPCEERLQLDLAVCKALGVEISKEELIELYGTIAKEMMITKSLTVH